MDTDTPQVDIDEIRSQLENSNKELEQASLSKQFDRLGQINSEIKQYEEIISSYERVEQLKKELEQNQELLNNPEFADMAAEENTSITTEITELTAKLQELTLPKLKYDSHNAIIEIRAGTGGTEASLFAAEIFRMYVRYSNSLGYQTEQMTTSYHEEGGIKEAVFEVNGAEAFGKLRFESGVHRVQRVPSTESSGRIHTSAVSVVVMPEIKPEEVKINDSDLRIEVYRSSGPGGQSVNTTDSAVRITHIPSGITVSCQDGKSQHKNKEKAMSVLASKLLAVQESEQDQLVNEMRSSAIQSGDRSAKIRTYNFPQGRITDHRIKHNWFNIPTALEGEIDEIVKTVNIQLRKQIGK